MARHAVAATCAPLCGLWLTTHPHGVQLPRGAVFLAFRALLGLKRARCPDTNLVYWWRAETHTQAAAPPEPPIVLCHGVCGFAGFLRLLLMRKCADRPVPRMPASCASSSCVSAASCASS